MKVFCQVLKNLRTAQVHVELEDESDVEIHSDCIALLRNGETTRRIALPFSVRANTAAIKTRHDNGTRSFDITVPLNDTSTLAHSSSADPPLSYKECKRLSQLYCRSCSTALIKPETEFICKPLPSEHWLELIECWMCHDKHADDYEERIQEIGARKGHLLVGKEYLLLHPSDILPETVRNPHVEEFRKTRSFRKWFPVQCSHCGSLLGEGLFPRVENSDGKNERFQALKIAKYQISACLYPAELEVSMENKDTEAGASLETSETLEPDVLRYIAFHMLESVQAHAVYRFLVKIQDIEPTKDDRTAGMPDLDILFSQGGTDSSSENKPLILSHKRVMKVLYKTFDQTEDLEEAMEQLSLQEDHLLYPASAIADLLEGLRKSTDLLPENQKVFREWQVGFLGLDEPLFS
ncbi:hypothetical protein BZG36_03751 [Bifiguratus adelaidae]|uniref:HECT-type E3 ubiquitin transferase E3D n=1 Tax=Bifiguratus adelaidae TaxID=1938954 RepID=A0A261XY57_9FUNG|nr:hypothetical protein BZG36_03751 [Bifiguratus adelaidae]